MTRGPRDYLTPDEITGVIHAVCIRNQPIKAVAVERRLTPQTVQHWVNRYESRDGARRVA